jgi:hypothetical protein
MVPLGLYWPALAPRGETSLHQAMLGLLTRGSPTWRQMLSFSVNLPPLQQLSVWSLLPECWVIRWMSAGG